MREKEKQSDRGGERKSVEMGERQKLPLRERDMERKELRLEVQGRSACLGGQEGSGRGLSRKGTGQTIHYSYSYC